jgi:hypothetical protein
MEELPKVKVGDKAKIPDQDMLGWIKLLREDGVFSEKEIDGILSRLNQTYAEYKHNPHIEEELKKIDDKTKEHRGVGLSEEEKEYFRRSIKTRYE